MREILFRGKTKSGEWHFGFFIKRKGIANIFKNGMLYEVEPETIGQFTGITDKNGVKVFEGDILLFGDTSFVVEWQNDIAGFGYFDTSDRILGCDGINCEVIGNIHENT